MEIGLFQLENLFLTPNRYLFFDLRVEITPSKPAIDNYLTKAKPIDAQKLHAHLKEQNTPKEFPVLVVCENGETSAEVARELEAAGYGNIYVVTGGVAGLLSEL